jgi:hypothetical protein
MVHSSEDGHAVCQKKKKKSSDCTLWAAIQWNMSCFGCAEVHPIPEFGVASDGPCL